MFEARAFISDLRPAERILIAHGAVFKGDYRCRDLIYSPVDPRKSLADSFVRLRVNEKNIWAEKDIVVAIKETRLGDLGKRSVIPMRKEFDSIAEAQSFIALTYGDAYKFDFEFTRNGRQYDLGRDQVDLETVMDVEGCYTIEFKSTREDELHKLARLLGLKETIKGPSAVAVKKILQYSRAQNKFGLTYLHTFDTIKMGVHYDLAEKIAARFKGYKICLDACVGAGMTAIPISRVVEKVIAIDTNPHHLELAKANAALAGVADRIEFIHGDVLKLLEGNLIFDCAFLDPDWASPTHSKAKHVTSLGEMTPRGDLLMEETLKRTDNVCLRLPKEFNLNELNNFDDCEVEKIEQDGKLKFFCVYFGDLRKM